MATFKPVDEVPPLVKDAEPTLEVPALEVSYNSQRVGGHETEEYEPEQAIEHLKTTVRLWAKGAMTDHVAMEYVASTILSEEEIDAYYKRLEESE